MSERVAAAQRVVWSAYNASFVDPSAANLAAYTAALNALAAALNARETALETAILAAGAIRALVT
jgi:hypothetical protein